MEKRGILTSGINGGECVGEKTQLDEAADSRKRYGNCVRTLSALLARQEGLVGLDEWIADRCEASEAEGRTDSCECAGSVVDRTVFSRKRPTHITIDGRSYWRGLPMIDVSAFLRATR